ncbi:MAG: type II secretion system F family protein [Aeropyrum sp.]|nr:type II secretion system F family protein [Aeropyrum sp.]
MVALENLPLISRLRKRRRREEEKVYRREVKISFMDIVDYISYRYFSWLAAYLVKTFEMDRALKLAGINTYPVMYMSRVLMISTAFLLLGLYLDFWILLSGASIIIKVLMVIASLLIPVMVIAVGLAYPSTKISSRKEGIEAELPFFAAYLSIMSRGGVPVSVVIERVSKLKIFKAIREEAVMIKTKIKLLGKNPLDALEEHAIENPSHIFRDFILGYTTAVKIGSDVVHYLEIRTQDLFDRRLNDIRILAERMTLYLEIYLIVAVIATIVFYIFFTISSVLPAGTGGFQGTAQLVLYSFVVMPTINIIMLVMVDRARPKTPVVIKSHITALIFYSLPIALLSIPFIIAFTNMPDLLAGEAPTRIDIILVSSAVSIVAILASIPPALVYFHVTRINRGISLAISNFLRDLAETRKTGLSPEQSVVSLSTRDYGPLSDIVRRIATSIEVGIPLEQAVRKAVRNVRDWVSLSSLRFLVDSIEVGGGNPEVLDALARYTYGLVTIQEEFRKRTRIYVLMPYLGAIIVASATLLVLGYTIKTLEVVSPEAAGATVPAAGLGISILPPEDLGRVALILSLGVLLNSWMMGLMAGKIRDGSIGAGFIHSILLVVITLIIIILGVFMLPLP